MLVKTLITSVLVVFSAFGALALDTPEGQLKSQILSDLQLADEVESLNEGEASNLWIRSSDDEDEAVESQQNELKGISQLEQ